MNAMSAKAVGYALAAMTASAVVLALVFLGYWSFVGSSEPRALAVPGKDFSPVVGQARVAGEQLVVSGLEGASPRRQAVLSLRRQLDSDAYRFLTIHISQLPPGLAATVYWRKSGQEHGDTPYSQPVPANVPGATTLDMALNPGWTGPLAEIGLLLAGETESLPIHFSGISLAGGGVGPALGSLLTQWAGFRSFDQATINRLAATFSVGALSPLMVAALWAAVFMLKSAALEVGAWRLESQTIVTPSQEWLFRAFRQGKRIMCNQEISLLVLYSGARKGAYRGRQFSEHEHIFELMAADDLVPTVTASIRVRERELEQTWSRRMRRLYAYVFEGVLCRAGIHPLAPEMLLRYGGRGGFVRKWKKLTS
jgi:hypothetical protein